MNQKIHDFLSEKYSHHAIDSIQPITQSGSSRTYYRFEHQKQSFILTESNNTEENKTFFYLTEHFSKTQTNLPKIDKISSDLTLYTQTDFGNQTLLDVLEKNPNQAFDLYKNSLIELVKMQVLGYDNLDCTKLFSYPKFNHILVLRDLFSFKNYFLNPLEIELNAGKLLLDFENFAQDFQKIPDQYFVYRDFQSRNIMVKENHPYFIDYQGGLVGPPQYDLVSILWQAKANLPEIWKNELYDFYVNEFSEVTHQTVNPIRFQNSYQLCMIERMLQVLGTYGFRGIFQHKKHFVQSIQYGLTNLQVLLRFKVLESYPELKSILEKLVQNDTIEKINAIQHA